MSKPWTNEKINQMLLIIIKRHYSGSPDFEYVAAQLGVTKDAARIKFNSLRRGFAIPEGNGLRTPPSSPVKKRKVKEMKAKGSDDGEEEVGFGVTGKRTKSVRAAAEKANGMLKEQFEEGAFGQEMVEEIIHVKQE